VTFTHFFNQKLIIPQSGIKLQLSKRVNRLNDPFEEKLHLQIKQCCELRLSVCLRPKKSVLFLVLQVWCCVVKHDLVTLVIIMILKVTTTFQVIFIAYLLCILGTYLLSVLGTSLLWRSTVAFTYLKVKSAKVPLYTSSGLGLVILIIVIIQTFVRRTLSASELNLILRIWFCLHHWNKASCTYRHLLMALVFFV